VLGRVLVVDDEAAMLRACSRLLAVEGWETTAVGDVRSALQAIEQADAPFDCVLSDIHMPEMDGFELVAAVRRHDDDIPVLLMTGDPSLDGAVRALDSGAVSYITKPFASEALLAAVARAARRHGVQRMRRRANSRASAVYGGDRSDVEQRFARALERSWMAFQPIIDIRLGAVFAYEALLRTDEESLARPDLFIAAAERLDRVHQLGRRVRGLVADAARGAPSEVKLFVNVHGLELSDEDLFAPSSPLAGFASRVVLEITERTGIDPAAGSSRVAMLRKLGYVIAVDDLGAGYSALAALASLEPEIVKLDMSLIRDLDRQPRKQRVVAAIATLCRELGGLVVAEGVETGPERDACVGAGIELLQGYLFGRPGRGFPTPSP
jgi:EAL domain-containing protein (putative c-di-GMP-specific phosphodiesterase class I)/CheY-like chemotaxis protein